METRATTSPSNISALSVKVQKLEHWSNLVSNFGVGLLAITLVIGIVSNRLNLRLNKAKDRLAAEEKMVSEEKIADANAIGASAKADAAKAQEEIAKAHVKTEELKRNNLVLESKVEKERSSRIELEQAVSPRIMEQHNSSEALKVLTGVTAIITNIPDLESQKMAGQLATTLNMAGWKIQFSPYNPKDIYSDGVIIESNAGTLPKEDISSKAAKLLLAQLKTNKIESRTMPTTDLPLNTIIVKVGFKPYTFFSDKMSPGENIRIHGNIIMPPR